MALFALGDLHLGFAVDKPMGVFGMEWNNHSERIEQAWRERVQDEDVVLLPGDISWAMTLDEAIPDLEFVGRLPGRKIMIKGNHDYWWSSISKVRKLLMPRHFAIQNDAISLDGYVIAGTRGWLLPTHPKFTSEDESILERECLRLRMSLVEAQKTGKPIVVMLHYPPLSDDGNPTVFTDVLEEFEVKLCVYGHLHGASHRYAFEGNRNQVQYHLVSADYLHFAPIPLNPILCP